MKSLKEEIQYDNESGTYGDAYWCLDHRVWQSIEDFLLYDDLINTNLINEYLRNQNTRR